MKITVIGAGRWGSFIAYYLDSIHHDVTLYGPADTPQMMQFTATRSNGIVTLPESLKLSYDIHSVDDAEAVVISIGSQGLRSLCDELSEIHLADKDIILCMKGIEIGTGKRLSEIVSEQLDTSNRVAVWIGPGHPQAFVAGIPNCMVIDSDDAETKHRLVDAFSSKLIRFYYGTDLVGNEIGAAAKNVIGIAAGMLDGLNLSSLKGPLMSRGTLEISRLIEAMGGCATSAYGLCHLGDYEATVFSPFSHNRAFGECVVKGQHYDMLAEGYYTAQAIHELADKFRVDLPICQVVYEILYHNAAPDESLRLLFSRSLKDEFYRTI